MKELKGKSKKYQELRQQGMSVVEAHKAAGYKGQSISAAYKSESRIKNASLTDAQTLNVSKRIARDILLTAKKALKDRAEDEKVQDQCIRLAMRIIEGQQDRIDPKKNINLNANVDVDFTQVVDLQQFKLR